MTTYQSVKRQLEELLAVEHPLSEAWTRHAYEGTEFAEWLDRMPEAGAAAIPVEVQAKALTAGLPEPARDRLIVWFVVRMVGSVGTINPEDIEFEDQDDAG